jgi:hypothetical protein
MEVFTECTRIVDLLAHSIGVPLHSFCFEPPFAKNLSKF